MFTLYQVRSFVAAKLSRKSKALQEERDAICRACDKYKEGVTRGLNGKYKVTGHCSMCGCGSNPIADIAGGKNAHSALKCPLMKWPGDTEKTGLSLHDAQSLYGARDMCEFGLAMMNDHLKSHKAGDVEREMAGRAKAVFDSHYNPSTEGSEEIGEAIKKVIAKLKLYRKVVQWHINRTLPLAPGLLQVIRGTPARGPQNGEGDLANRLAAQSRRQAAAAGKKGCCGKKSESPIAPDGVITEESVRAASAARAQRQLEAAKLISDAAETERA